MDVSISIIVAIYNRRDELTELLDSLLVQEDKIQDQGSAEITEQNALKTTGWFSWIAMSLSQGITLKTLKIISKPNRPMLLVERIKPMKTSPIYKRQFLIP